MHTGPGMLTDWETNGHADVIKHSHQDGHTHRSQVKTAHATLIMTFPDFEIKNADLD